VDIKVNKKIAAGRGGWTFVWLVAAAVFLVACGGGEQTVAAVAPTFAAPPPSGQISMGGGALGGNAATTVLAQAQLAQLPAGPLAWVTHRVELPAGAEMVHRHSTAFVYAAQGEHGLDVESLPEGRGAAVMEGIEHRHHAPGGASVFWETRLDRSGSVAAGIDSDVLFESPVLVEIPATPFAVFVLVVIPPGGATSVHTHPGPEFIYQLSGGIDYQNDIIGVRRMTPGDVEGIPPVTAVQKRNPTGEDAAFLSWFLVDSSQPFASPAGFNDTALGPNLALLENGASVAGVSSNFGGGTNDSAFELPSETNVTSVGFWTRTMGDSAQVNLFRVTTDRGETYGPFSVDDATTIYRFDTRFTAKRLRFELLDTTGGNTGAVEIEVYGEPMP